MNREHKKEDLSDEYVAEMLGELPPGWYSLNCLNYPSTTVLARGPFRDAREILLARMRFVDRAPLGGYRELERLRAMILGPYPSRAAARVAQREDKVLHRPLRA
jgi:hypothetical protein